MKVFPTKEELHAETKRLDQLLEDNRAIDAWSDVAEEAVHSFINRILSTTPSGDASKVFWARLLSGVAGAFAAHYSLPETQGMSSEELSKHTTMEETMDVAIAFLQNLREFSATLTPEEREELDRAATEEADAYSVMPTTHKGGGFTL